MNFFADVVGKCKSKAKDHSMIRPSLPLPPLLLTSPVPTVCLRCSFLPPSIISLFVWLFVRTFVRAVVVVFFCWNENNNPQQKPHEKQDICMCINGDVFRLFAANLPWKLDHEFFDQPLSIDLSHDLWWYAFIFWSLPKRITRHEQLFPYAYGDCSELSFETSMVVAHVSCSDIRQNPFCFAHS